MSRWLQSVSFLAAMMLSNATPAQEAPKVQKTVVLIHGAFADGSTVPARGTAQGSRRPEEAAWQSPHDMASHENGSITTS